MTALYIALAVLLLVDWRQTLVIARNPQQFFERNPILGKHPSVGAVHAWFAFASLAFAAVLYLLAEWRLELALLFCAAELVCIFNNHRIGVRP